MRLRITIAGKVYEADVEVLEEEESPSTTVPAFVLAAVPAGAAVNGGTLAAGVSSEEEKICRSPLAGLVIRVQVEVGQSVEANQPLVVLEAMKMETQVTAACSGVVEKVHVKPGNPVKTGQVLVELR